jgi:hypothetical protein
MAAAFRRCWGCTPSRSARSIGGKDIVGLCQQCRPMRSAGAVIQPGSCTQTTNASSRRCIYWARRCTSRPDQTSSLSLAMGLTTILTTIWVCHRNAPKSKALICKGNRTSTDSLGHAADVWGSRAMSSRLVRRHRDDLAIADDLVLPMRPEVSLLIPPCHRHYPLRRERRTPFSTYSSLGETSIPPRG